MYTMHIIMKFELYGATCPTYRSRKTMQCVGFWI